MTPEQQATLRAAIHASPACAAALAAKDCPALAAIMSVGRVRFASKMITERGVRAALPVDQASPFLRILKASAESADVPAWLATTLTAMGVPAPAQADYAETIASAYGWLRQDAGIDIGSAATRGMLDLIAAGNPSLTAAVMSIKALASEPDPLTAFDVAQAVFNDDGTEK